MVDGELLLICSAADSTEIEAEVRCECRALHDSEKNAARICGRRHIQPLTNEAIVQTIRVQVIDYVPLEEITAVSVMTVCLPSALETRRDTCRLR